LFDCSAVRNAGPIAEKAYRGRRKNYAVLSRDRIEYAIPLCCATVAISRLCKAREAESAVGRSSRSRSNCGMNATKQSRRAALGALASIPALALPVVATAGAAPAADPVFAAIEAHRASWVTLKAAIDRAERARGNRGAPPKDIQARDDADAAEHAADAAERAAMAALQQTPPTTATGLKAALGYFVKWDDDIPQDTGAYLQTILRSPPSPIAAIPAAALAAPDDAELLTLAAEIESRRKLLEDFQTRIKPLDDEWEAVPDDAAYAFSHMSGREQALKELDGIFEETDLMLDRMRALPARTRAGMAAKARTILMFCLLRFDDGWKGPGINLDWEKDHARALLGEIAGMSEAELAAI